jgi:hypothetical protein
MITKTYSCDTELEKVLLKQGLVETTDVADKRKGKKEFRRSKNSPNCIRFDYINLVIFEHGVGINGLEGSRIAEDDLKLFFWYFNSNTGDKNYISDGHFDLKKTRRCAEHINNLLQSYREFNISNSESRKFERLLNNLNSIQLN